jgi:hypothetical protein
MMKTDHIQLQIWGGPRSLDPYLRAVAVGKCDGQSIRDGPTSIDHEHLPKRGDPVRDLGTVSSRGYRDWRDLLAIREWGIRRAGEREGTDLVQAEAHREARGREGMSVALEWSAVNVEVYREKARRLHDVDKAVRVVERDGDFVQRTREEHRLNFRAVG